MTARSVGVEEEFLLFHDSAAVLADAGDAVVHAASDIDGDGQFEHELKRPQAELGSAPTQSLADLGADLGALRGALAAASVRHGARMVASATNPLGTGARTTAEPRYEEMVADFGLVGRHQLSCGMHVHVSIESPEEGVAVLDRVRPWLPVLVALSANSPFYAGQDTGYASYRTMLWGQWPTAGPTEAFGDVASYERVRQGLITTGAARDDGMIYFDARLSAHYPTVEIRVCDVCVHTEDAVTIAGLARGLVATAADQWRAGRPAPDIRTELLRAASWRSARWGMAGDLVRFTLTGQDGSGVGEPEPELVPAWDLVQSLLDEVTPALETAGDLQLVSAGVARIRGRGTGAQQQRAVSAARGLTAVIDALTVAPARD